MNRFLIAASALLLTGSAFAADLPSKKAPLLPPPPPPPPIWTGFYVGLNAGYTWADNKSTSVTGYGANGAAAAVAAIPVDRDGFIGGGQIGYNYQFGNKFLVGLEADIQGVAASNNSASWVSGTTQISAGSSLDYLGTVRGRIGYLATPTLLIYGTGGLAYGGVNTSVAFSAGAIGTGAGAFSDTRVGWTAGGGVEWLFLPQWSAKAEYLYYDLGSVGYAAALTNGSARASQSFNGHVVRAGVNYHFNLFNPPAAPVVAKF